MLTARAARRAVQIVPSFSNRSDQRNDDERELEEVEEEREKKIRMLTIRKPSWPPGRPSAGARPRLGVDGLERQAEHRQPIR
jgi:hypothetical protein